MDDYDYERKQRREREKSERQQVQTSSSNREVALFSEPRRVNPSEDDDKIAAKLGDYSKVKDFINLYTVGISNSGHRQMPANAILPGIVPTSSPLPNVSAVVATASSSMGSSSSQRLLPPPAPQSQQQSQQPPHHYQQQQQQLRQIPYVKQADNKPPYNGRGGYPGQPVNRLSSGMAPPKGPPSGNLLPPATTHMPNGRQTSSASSIEKSFLGPPTAVSSSSSATHNGRFSQPSIPKQRQKPLPPENDIKEIINHVTNTFCPPKMLTGIDATPHNTLIENYNLSEKNKHKYSFDILAKTSIVEPLDSPPRMQMPAPRFVPPSSNSSINQMPFSKSTSNICSSSAATSSSSTYIAPVINTTASAGNLSSTSSSSGQSSSIISNAAKTSPTISHSPILSRPSSKDTLIKSLKIEKPTPLLIEKQNSTLENDLELSDSDDDRKKQNCSTVNSSDSSPSDSSESGSDSSRSESHQSAAIPAAHQLINQQQKMGPVMTSKKKLGSGSIAGSGSSSSGLGSSAPPSGGSSSSSSNKTPSPSNTTKWQLSRYFNKAPLHQTPTQDVVSPSTTSMVNSVNSVNVANLNMPITLRGGAQIIPEPPQHVANIKNESIMEDVDDDNDNNGNEVDDDKIRGRNKVGNKSDTFPHPAFPSRKAPAGLSVTPLSPIMSDIKKEISTPHVGIVVNQQQMPILNASEFVSIPSTQIKHENMSIGRGHTTVTYGGDVIEGLSNLSSDSNSNDEERIPVRGPGGTLQIPGVPAAITALPRSPPEVQKTQLLNNSVTMIRLDPLNSTATTHLARPPPPQSRAKKPRKKLKQQTSATVAPDTSDEEQDDLTKHRLVNPIANVAVGGKTSISATGPKKGRGRPRKTTPNQSGNISSTSSASASAKGPTLTAKKDISKKPALTNTVSATSRRRTSRLHSSVSLAQDLPMPTKQIHIPTSSADNLPTTQLIAPVVPIKEQLITATATSDDSSSSTESSSCSISKSSSSDSDTEIEGSTNKRTIITNSSSSGDDGIKRRSINNKFSGGGEHKVAPPKRIVKKLNTRKSSLEDIPTQLTSTNKSYILTSSSSSSSSESSIEDSSYLPNALTLFGGLSQQPAPIVSGGSSSQRLINHQSPHKVASAFFSESSGEDRSDSDSGQIRKEKKLKRDKPKSDKNKISTLTRIFKSSNEGGAKKQGQVLIVDQSEDQQQQQKHISPALRLSQDNLSTVNNSLQNTTQSPRLTPSGQMISPRSFNMTPLASQVLATSAVTTHRTPDRSTTSAERKLQHRIKTPTRTPTRTPPTTRTPTPTPAVAAASVAHHALTNPLPLSSTTSHILQQQPSTPLPPPPPTSLICKIDLSRLLNVPMEWQANTYRLYGHAPGHQQNRLTPSAGRTPIYDHETILNADLQSCNNQMRLKSTSSGNFNGSATPRSTGNRTPTQITPTISASEKERPELGKEIGNSGRLSSRSTDGSICGGGLTPKEHLLPPNGYNSSASIVRGYNSPNGGGNVKLLTSVKHEQIIKHEPDSEYSCNETKFKSDSSTNPTIIKQELLILKQDYKPSDLSEKSSLCSPNNLAIEPKPRRKRSTSSSSSSYKEKKRKKEKDIGIGTLTENDKLVDSVNLLKDKEVLNESLKSPRESISMDVCLNKANEQGQTQTQVHQILDQQFSPTNHDRLHVENKLQQQNVDKSNNNCRKLANNVSKTASPAHSQNANNNLNTVVSTSMPPPANVGLLPTISPPPSSLTCTKNAPILSPKTILPTASSSPCASGSPLTIATSSPALSTTAVGAAATSATAASTTETQVIYRSYFERDDDALSDEFSKDAKFLQEAVHRKHAADREQNTFNQVTLYLEAVVYFLLSGAAMEQHSRSEDAAWTMYKDTLTLIKFISSKFRHLQVSSGANQHENHNKVAILSLRCQSLISLKLFKLKRNFCRQINTICADFFKSGKGDIINGNTPSPISPSNSVGSQGSGSNTPPGKIVPQDIHSALYQQNQYFSYLASSHELWDQADRLVRQGNHTDFFIALDHENGPLTLHSNVYEVFRYVQAGLKKLKDEMLIQ